MNPTLYRSFGKRWFDICAAVAGLMILWPLFLVVAVAIKLTSKGPVFYLQNRVGQFGKEFRILKFRSMLSVSAQPAPLLTAASDPRITRVGRWLRKTKIDELPQLVNVLLGEMSLVGPRPEVSRYTAFYTKEQRRVLLAKPGITGPSANVYEEELLSNRDDAEEFYVTTILPAKLETDLLYCENIRFQRDLKVIVKTFIKIFSTFHSRKNLSSTSLQQQLDAPARKVAKPAEFPSGRSANLGATMTKSFPIYSRVNQVILDSAAFSVSFVAAYAIRFEGWPAGRDLRQILFWLPVIIGARLLAHFLTGIYRHVWRFVSFSDALEMAKSIGAVSFVLLLLRFLPLGRGAFQDLLRIPLSVIVLEGLLSLGLSMGIRTLRRLMYARERRLAAAEGTGQPSKRVLLYGAGRAGIMLRKELENNLSFDVVGFVDDDAEKVGSVISKTRVVGSGDQLERMVEKYRVDEIIISMATASRMTLALALAKCRRANVPAKIIPSLQEILTGQVQISQLRETRMEEVLGRESVEVLEFEEVAGATYRGKRVLVTGAGGSIGSELVRQLARLAPAAIAILDKDENSIYELEQESLRRKFSTRIEPHIADVRDSGRLRAVFSAFMPHVVFHAAAHKHVPLMELHPCEAILNNVGGTQNVLNVCAEYAVERFVFISSDKAVNPANVMGATKRIGEMLVQTATQSARTRFACVRFGNVLGSRGSVIPLFSKQIAEGGPVTVTHPDMVRYFMTIQEAVQLILCAGTLARGGETFVLDMGNPRHILELAREMILLSGLEPGKDIEMKIVGLRPGEKLFEELVAPSERLLQTPFEKLSVIEPGPRDIEALMDDVFKLVATAKNNDHRGVHRILGTMGLGFQSQELKAMSAAASD